MSVSTKQLRIAKAAQGEPGRCLTSLHHHIDTDWLIEAYRRTRKSGATGVDGVSGREYGEHLEENIHTLLDRAKSGRYRAPAVRRVHIPKGPGQTRPLGIPTFEDKLLQRAVAMLLEPIYESDFLACSYGFRPRRSPHQAVGAIWSTVMSMGGCWVIDADISKYFDTINHGHLRGFLDKRVRDGVVRRLIGKWLKAGVMEDGLVSYQQEGTPQGGVISPLLSNIYLHEVLDTWYEREIQPRLRDEARLVRFADDFVILLRSEADARRVLKVLPLRFAKYGLTIHPEKTKLVRFGPPSAQAESGTFDFLGFTHYWGRSRRGRWVVKRKTSRKKLTKALGALREWCAESRSMPLREQARELRAKLRGHYQYYGINGNNRWLVGYYHQAKRVWHKWLNRRTRKRGNLPWERFNAILREVALPRPRIVHSNV